MTSSKKYEIITIEYRGEEYNKKIKELNNTIKELNVNNQYLSMDDIIEITEQNWRMKIK